jgi:hypothetical protein
MGAHILLPLAVNSKLERKVDYCHRWGMNLRPSAHKRNSDRSPFVWVTSLFFRFHALIVLGLRNNAVDKS